MIQHSGLTVDANLVVRIHGGDGGGSALHYLENTLTVRLPGHNMVELD